MTASPRTSEFLVLLQMPGIGPVTAYKILGEAGDSPLLEADHSALRGASEGARQAAADRADEIVDECETMGVAIVGPGDPEFPASLTSIPDPPAILYVIGSPDVLSTRGVAVVGTRKASESGLRIARGIGRYLADVGYCVYSGLALGIDSAAHLGSLEGGGPTVAVLAHGLHTVSPASNRDLAGRIVEEGGVLVSEHPPGVPPRPPEYVRRNRLQCGLAVASVVVESGVKGGTIHHAQFARKQGRRLMVVTAGSDVARRELDGSGAKHLVAALGAVSITSTADLGRELAALDNTEHSGGPPVFKQTTLDW